MTTSVDTETWVESWLADFRACLAGAHGNAWRSHAERELRENSPAVVSDRQRAASWRRVREEILGSPPPEAPRAPARAQPRQAAMSSR